MRVKFKVNLGSRDAEKHSLDFKQCGEGMEGDVSESAGAWLVRNGIAGEVHRELRGVSAEPAIADASEPSIKAELKPTPTAAKKSAPHHKES